MRRRFISTALLLSVPMTGLAQSSALEKLQSDLTTSQTILQRDETRSRIDAADQSRANSTELLPAIEGGTAQLTPMQQNLIKRCERQTSPAQKRRCAAIMCRLTGECRR